MADEITSMTYEAALAELDAIIDRLERGDVELEAAITAYERGAALTRHCGQLLDRTEQKITQLVVGAAGEVERPFQPPSDRGEMPAEPAPQAAGAEERLFGARPVAGAPRGVAIDPDDIPF